MWPHPGAMVLFFDILLPNLFYAAIISTKCLTLSVLELSIQPTTKGRERRTLPPLTVIRRSKAKLTAKERVADKLSRITDAVSAMVHDEEITGRICIKLDCRNGGIGQVSVTREEQIL